MGKGVRPGESWCAGGCDGRFSRFDGIAPEEKVMTN